MPWFDIFILLVILISTVVSIVRGFAKDSISLAAWILAFVIALSLADKFAIILPDSMENPRLRVGVSIAVLFLATLIMGMIANFLLAGFINMVKMQNIDRGLGALFGFARGVVIVCLLVVLGSYIGLNEADWWEDSALVASAEGVLDYIEPLLPNDFARYIKV
ncbi:MAG: CvpA family protein [Gammaproteobacteria bacterium]|nr:CvpA family protein [Gammaproteobacteria bacterium]